MDNTNTTPSADAESSVSSGENTAHTNSTIGAGDLSLEDRLSRPTERKEPASSATLSDSKGFWGDEDDDDEESVTQNAGSSKSFRASNDGPIPKATEESFRVSARTFTSLFDSVQKMLFSTLLDWKYSKKLTPEEWDRAERLLDMKESMVADADAALYNRAKRVMAKWQKKSDAVPMNPKEIKDTEEAFYEYCKITGKSLSPNWFAGLQLANVVMKRGIDLMTN